MADDGKLTAELAAIGKYAEAATPGPWTLRQERSMDIAGEVDDRETVTGPGGEEIAITFWSSVLEPDNDADGKFIADARSAVPLLLKAVEAVLNLTADWQRNWAEGEAPHELARELREAIERELTGEGSGSA